MTLNVIRVANKRSNYHYIILRKNLKHLCVLGLHYSSSGLLRFCKSGVFILDIPRIRFWVLTHKLVLPKWLHFFYKRLTHVSYYKNQSVSSSSYPEVDKVFVPRTSVKDLSRIRKNTFVNFYKYRMVSGSWHCRNMNLTFKSNVNLYSKKV